MSLPVVSKWMDEYHVGIMQTTLDRLSLPHPHSPVASQILMPKTDDECVP